MTRTRNRNGIPTLGKLLRPLLSAHQKADATYPGGRQLPETDGERLRRLVAES